MFHIVTYLVRSLVSPSNQQAHTCRLQSGENVQKFQISEDDETKDCRGEECPAHDGQGEEGHGEDQGPGGEVALLLSQ